MFNLGRLFQNCPLSKNERLALKKYSNLDWRLKGRCSCVAADNFHILIL